MAGKKSGVNTKEETKEEKFIRLAEDRVTKAVKYINAIGNLSTNAYYFNKDQVSEIVMALSNAVKSTMDRFDGKRTVSGGFRLTQQGQ